MPNPRLKIGKLTPKAAKFTRAVIKQIAIGKTVNLTEAALEAYDTKDRAVASAIGAENLGKPLIRETIEESLRAAGLDATTLATEARKIATAEVEKVSADAKLRSIVEIWKLMGAYPDRKSAHLNLNLKGNIKDMDFQKAKDELQRINSESTVFIEEAE